LGPAVQSRAALEDRELVQKLLAKDAEAQGFLYQTYRDRLYRTCVYILGYQDRDAEDLVHETFMEVLRDLPQFKFQSSLSWWMRQVCVHQCFKQLRKRKRWVMRLDEELEALSGPADMEKPRQEQQEQRKQKILETIEAQRPLLGKPCQEILELRETSGKSYAELSQMLQVPIGTVMSRLARCKEALKELVIRALPKEHL